MIQHAPSSIIQFFSTKRKFNFLFLFVVALLVFSCKPTQKVIKKPVKKTVEVDAEETVFAVGADNFEGYAKLLKNKSVGVVTNQTGVLSDGTNLVDFLISKEVDVKRIFAPEHGFRGVADAGELVDDGIDAKTGIPIISLYGDNKKPQDSQLIGIDVMLFDIQDVGVRFYTYISTLSYIMEACAANNIPLVILDRPNPNGGIIDGPILEMQFNSFVGMNKVPILYGMTIGEYAKMLNGERWLKEEQKCELNVVACSNYNRDMFYSLPVKPSPNLPNDQSINLYASLCLFEGTNVSVGRGTEQQFQIYGSPYLHKSDFSFVPRPNLGAKDPLYNNVECYGEDLTAIPKVNALELKWLIKAYDETADKSKFFNNFFVKLAGTQSLQKQIEIGMPEEVIKQTWQEDLEKFKKMRAHYLIY